MKKFNRKRLAGLLASWCALAGAIWWLSYQETHVCMFGFLLLFSLTSLLSLYLLWRPLRTVTAALIVGFVLFGTPVQNRAQDPWILECSFALVVIGVGVVVVVGLVRTCDRCLPPTEPPAQPPAPSPNTNIIHHTLPRTNVTLNLKDEALGYYDVSSLTLSNSDSHGNSFHVWFHGTVQSSTNLNHWKNEYTINGWASATELVTVYSVNDAPVYTNRSNLAGGIDDVEIPSVTGDEPAKFFRLVP